MRTLVIALLFVIPASCADESEVTLEPTTLPSPIIDEAVKQGLPAANQVAVPARPLPENVQIEGDWLFAMETTPELLELPFHGSSLERLAGRLTDEEGRREIVFYGAKIRAPKVLFRSDWLLPAVGAVNRTGEALVCVNRLVGAPTELTKGNVPDPANGIDLVCRWRSSRGWSREYLIPRRGAALWLTDVVAVRGGTFRVTYGEDSTGQLVDDAALDEGIYRVSFDRGRLGKPELASRFERP